MIFVNAKDMTKRYFDSDTYNKIGSPDLGCKMYIIRAGKKIYGTVCFLNFTGIKSKHKGKIEVGLKLFCNETKNR